MFGTEDRGSEFARIVKEARERVGAPLDFNALVLWKLASAYATDPNSPKRHREIQDLENMLHPYLDPDYRDWKEGALAYQAECKANGLWNEWDNHYQGAWLDELMDLLKRKGLIAFGMI